MMYSPRSFLSLYSCPWYNFDVFFHSTRRWMRRPLWRRVQHNRSLKSLARLSLSSIINYNLITTGTQRSLLTFLSQNLMIWNTSEENHKTSSGSCACKTRSHFPVEILNWNWEYWTGKLETGKCDEIPFSTPHSQFSSFPVSVCYVTSFSNWKTGKLEKLEKCKQCLSQDEETSREPIRRQKMWNKLSFYPRTVRSQEMCATQGKEFRYLHHVGTDRIA